MSIDRNEAGVIRIVGAREHNLKNLTLDIPRNKMVVITGLSGSGKSSLAFDTLYAEGQRRYVESLSAYARQFLGLMEKPDVEHIEGLSPAISIEQKSGVRNPRSTVGTVTEIYDYLRLLYARIGIPHCPSCGREIARQSAQEIVDKLLDLPIGAKLTILAPVIRGRKGEYQELLKGLVRDGFVRARIDGKLRSLDEEIRLDKQKKHSIEVIIDRLVIGSGLRERLTDSVELALKQASGLMIAHTEESGDELYSELYACPTCGISFEELTPRLFSFNSPFGACPTCTGLGVKMELDPRLIVPDPNRTLREGAVLPLTTGLESWTLRMLEQTAHQFGFELDVPYCKLSEESQGIVLHGTKGKKVQFKHTSADGRSHWEHEGVWEGVIPNLSRRYKQTTSAYIREWIEGFMGNVPCPDCHGERLKPESRAVTVGGLGLSKLTDLSIIKSAEFVRNLELGSRDSQIAQQILKEVSERLNFLLNVGLGYLTLARSAGSLSGGEAQRIRLATQIGSGLVGVMYILDEPSIGLHQRDNLRLIRTLKNLRDLGNSVIVVEHDQETMEEADWIIDLGPGAGRAGGEIVAQGTPMEVKANQKSVTGRYLSGVESIELPKSRRPPNPDNMLVIRNAAGNNLKGVDAAIPLGLLVVVTGVSGSGKSSLVVETLYPALARSIFQSRLQVLDHGSIEGLKKIDKVVDIDQSPIGRTPRSNPATYTGLFDPVRNLFAEMTEAKVRGYKSGRFSFNVKGGRCEQCQGGGIIKIEMHFLPDVYVTCDLCKGKRYNRETLEVKFKGKSIADVLDMTVDEAVDFFREQPIMRRKLETLSGVGLGYIHLGQQATTLSGGEAQRIKLSAELSKVGTGKTIYILDEPTTGLHFADVKMLLQVIQQLVDKGNTVLVIEHNLDVIKCADWVIDLGPEGGDAGGLIIAEGPPEVIATAEASHTGAFLRKLLPSAPVEPASNPSNRQRGRRKD